MLHCVERNLRGRTEKDHGNFCEVAWNTSADSTWHLTEQECRTLPL